MSEAEDVKPGTAKKAVYVGLVLVDQDEPVSVVDPATNATLATLGSLREIVGNTQKLRASTAQLLADAAKQAQRAATTEARHKEELEVRKAELDTQIIHTQKLSARVRDLESDVGKLTDQKQAADKLAEDYEQQIRDLKHEVRVLHEMYPAAAMAELITNAGDLEKCKEKVDRLCEQIEREEEAHAAEVESLRATATNTAGSMVSKLEAINAQLVADMHSWKFRAIKAEGDLLALVSDDQGQGGDIGERLNIVQANVLRQQDLLHKIVTRIDPTGLLGLNTTAVK